MKPIKHRGKALFTDKWVEGELSHSLPDDIMRISVHEEYGGFKVYTVCNDSVSKAEEAHHE